MKNTVRFVGWLVGLLFVCCELVVDSAWKERT